MCQQADKMFFVGNLTALGVDSEQRRTLTPDINREARAAEGRILNKERLPEGNWQ